MLGVEVLHRVLLEVRVQLDLVHGGHHRRHVQQPGQVVDHEVGDPDGADLAVGQQGLQRPVGRQGLVELRRQRLVQDQQVDLVDAELAGRLLEAVQGLVVAVVADPDLRLHEHLATGPGRRRRSPRRPDVRCRTRRRCRRDGSRTRAPPSTASRVSSGGVWNTPRPRAGIVTPLFRVRVDTSGMAALPLSSGVVRVSGSVWRQSVAAVVPSPNRRAGGAGTVRGGPGGQQLQLVLRRRPGSAV